MLVLTSDPGFALSTLTDAATAVLTWLVTTWGTIINFLLQNPVAFIGLIMWLIVAAIGIVRRFLGA